MATLVYIQGLSGAGFRVPDNTGALKRVKEGVSVQVDIDNIKTQLILAGERDNFIRVANGGSTTATIVGLTRYGFRIASGGAYHVVKIGAAPLTVDLNDPTVRRVLRRNYGRYVVSASATAVTIRGVQAAQANGFDISSKVAATTTLSSDGTVPAVGDTVTINDKTYRFETTLAAANDVKIGATSDATLDSLVKAVNLTGVVGTDYFAGTTSPTDVSAANRTGTGATGAVVFSAKTVGTGGNAYPSTETSAHLSFGAATFTGGTESGALTKVFRGVSTIVDATLPDVYTRLRRMYKNWIEG